MGDWSALGREAEGCGFNPRCGPNLEIVLVAGEVVGHLQSTSEVLISKV